MRTHDAGYQTHPVIRPAATGEADLRGGNETPAVGTTLPFSAPRDVRRQLELAVHQLNSGSIRSGMFLRFAVDYSENPATVRVTDSKTGDLVRSIPWGELLPELDRSSGGSLD
ncbi:flagellar protein FlaG [Lentisalinibacter orientalis]|uniref:flagellar protein FlaG n=1 Tax=Lentisalinibacter orientalis TaxID=2992241 RepID=UPI0038633ABB